MSVDDRNLIDGIGIEKGSAIVVLTVSDHRVWGDPEHLMALQNKLNDYFGFIESGQLLESYPDAVGRKVRIDIVCKYVPDPKGERFLQQARQVVEAAGWLLSWFVFDDVQHDGQQGIADDSFTSI
jgi:hypothetical protein